MFQSYRRNMAVIVAAFLLCGILHIFFYGVDFTDNISRIYCGVVAIVWGSTVRKRVTEPLLRRLLSGVVLTFLLFLAAQMVTYRFGQDQETVVRYAWFVYYVAMMASAVMVCYAACFCRRAPGQKRGPFFWLPLAAGLLFTVGILTNDLHSLAFRFTGEGKISSSPKVYGPLFYLFYILLFVLLLASYLIVSRKYRTIRRRWSHSLLILMPLFILLVFFILDMMGWNILINGIEPWKMGEAYCFSIIAFLETNIDLGLIPANTGYEKLFAGAGLSAVILDSGGAVRYASSGVQYPFPQEEGILVRRHPISGGEVVWGDDVSALQRLNRETEETNQKIQTRNAYLASEADVKKERSKKETRNRIYDEITRVVRPQLGQITDRMDASDAGFDEKLRDIAVLCAYIKRRSNMELLGEDGTLPYQELSLAVAESMDYVRLKEIPAASYSYGEGTYPARMVIAAYEQMEAVIEDCLDSLSALMVTTRAATHAISLRMMIRAENIAVPEPVRSDEGLTTEISASKEGADMILSFTFRKGGENG